MLFYRGIIFYFDAVPVYFSYLMVLRSALFIRNKAVKGRAANLLNGKGAGWVPQVFDLSESKNMLFQLIADGYRLLCAAWYYRHH